MTNFSHATVPLKRQGLELFFWFLPAIIPPEQEILFNNTQSGHLNGGSVATRKVEAPAPQVLMQGFTIYGTKQILKIKIFSI